MRGMFKRLSALVVTLCLCTTLMPAAVSAALTPAKLGMKVSAAERSDGSYDVTYTADLTMTEGFAKAAAVYRSQDERMNQLRFTCILDDALVSQLDVPMESEVTFSGAGANNYEFISIKKESGAIHITYKLKDSVVNDWKTMSTEAVKNMLTQPMSMTGTRNVTAAQLEAAKNSDGVLRTEGKVVITYTGGLIPTYNTEEMLAAEGYTTLGMQTATPDITGVSEYLNTDDHVVYMVGDDKGTFRPNANITRAEVAQVFYALLKNKNVPITVSFNDVDDDAWYATAVKTLASMGVVKGVGNNNFAPTRAITRAEFATIAANFAKTTSGMLDFSDVSDAHWAYNYIAATAAYGWVMGVGDGRFEPDRTIMRAEAATIVNNMLGRIGDYDKIDAGLARKFPDVDKSHWGWYEIGEATTEHDHSYNSDKTVETWVK